MSKGVVYVIYDTTIDRNGTKSRELLKSITDELMYSLYSYITNARYEFERDERYSIFNLGDETRDNIDNYKKYTKNSSNRDMEKDKDELRGAYSSSYLPLIVVIWKEATDKKEYLKIETSSDVSRVRERLKALS